MARFNPRGLRPGSTSYDDKKEGWLHQRQALAEATAKRSNKPEVIRRAKRRAAAAQRELRRIKARREYREQLSERDRSEFNRDSIKEQDQLRRTLQQYPDGVPPDIPDPFAGRHRNSIWRQYYSSRGRAGTPLRGTGLERSAAD
jgi:hypothetical protein